MISNVGFVRETCMPRSPKKADVGFDEGRS